MPQQGHNPNNYGRALMSAFPQAITPNPYTNLLNVYTGCPRRNVPDFRRVFLMVKCTDITQNTYVQRR
jgi:hypothetical protein